MTNEGLLLILFGVVIVLLLFIMYIMYVRIKQLLTEMDDISSRMEVTDSELDNLTRNVEEFKKLRI